MPFDKIFDNGVISAKNSYIKIIRVIPINYNLKTNLEKESILNSYKLFLKTCDFNIQILIQSKKESLSKTFLYLDKKSQNENKKIKELSEKYKEFVNVKNEGMKASSKNFFVVIKQEIRENQKEEEKNLNEQIAINMLNEKFFKVKETLSRCGNIVYDVNQKEEVATILSSFITTKKEYKGE